jgi:hypothetical protein
MKKTICKVINYLAFSTILALNWNCHSYRVATLAQPSTEPQKVIIRSSFWGLARNPVSLATPICDQMGVNGVASVSVKKNFGRQLVTLITLGFYSATELEYACSKPCPRPE